MLGYASKLSCNSLSCSSASLQKLVQEAWHTSQSWGCLCWVPSHRSGTAGVSLGQAIPSYCDTTEVSCQQRVVLKWLILTKSVSGSSSFIFQTAACRGRPPCEFNHWHPASLPSLWGQHTSYTSSGRCHLFPNPLQIRGVQFLAQCRTVTINNNWPLQKTACRRQMDCFMSNIWHKTSFPDY